MTAEGTSSHAALAIPQTLRRLDQRPVCDPAKAGIREHGRGVSRPGHEGEASRRSQGQAGPTCLDAADADDSGALDISDPVYLLGFLFLGTSAPAEPLRACGPDPTPDGLKCAVFRPCE